MKKHEAISLFGGQRKLADALGITTQAVSQWPDDLPQRLTDQVVGAALRVGFSNDICAKFSAVMAPELYKGEAA